MSRHSHTDNNDDCIYGQIPFPFRFLSIASPLEENLGPFDCSWGRIMTRCVSSSLFDFLHTFEFPARNHSKGERKKEENRSG